MTLIEFTDKPDDLNLRQRWANFLTLVAAALLILGGLAFRNNTLNAVVSYANTRAGISAEYPVGWLLDTNSSAYVFRIRDMGKPRYKTTLQVAVRPIGGGASPTSVADSLTRERARSLIAYSASAPVAFTLNDDTNAISQSYTFVDQLPSPFLESEPAVVRGIDVITIRRGQAIIVTYRAPIDEFDDDFSRFDAFLNSLEY